MATEAWTVDGRNLSAFAFDIQTWDGLDDVPGLVGDNTGLPTRHGSLWVKKYFGPGHKTLSMIVSNRDPSTGVVPTALDQQRLNFDKNLDTIVRMMYRPRRLLDIRRTLSDGTVRQCFAEVVAGIAPETVGLNSGRMTFELEIPGGFWQDVSITTSALHAPGTYSVTEFEAATAPMQDLNYKLTGPATNPKVLDVESGAWFRFNGVMAAGNTLEVNAASMTILPGGGLVAALSQMEHQGDPRWLTLYPSMDGAQIQFTATATTGATGLQVIGTRKYLR